MDNLLGLAKVAAEWKSFDMAVISARVNRAEEKHKNVWQLKPKFLSLKLKKPWNMSPKRPEHGSQKRCFH